MVPFAGKYFCLEKVKPCESSPCHNQGTCITNPADKNDFICQCGQWLTGKYCEGKCIQRNYPTISEI